MRLLVASFLLVFGMVSEAEAQWQVSLKSCGSLKVRSSLVEASYRMISGSVPHTDRFYPSCSRYIKFAYHRYSIFGLIIGLGRFSRAHLPPIQKDFKGVLVNGDLRIFDPLEGMTDENSVTNFSAYPSFYTDCDESRFVQAPVSYDNRPDSSWRL